MTETMASRYAVETKKIVYMSGDNLTPQKGIANLTELPKATTFSWQDGIPKLTVTGMTRVTVVVNYPDNSKAAVKVPVEVLPKVVKKTGHSSNVSVPFNHKIKRNKGTVLSGNQRGTLMDSFSGIGVLAKVTRDWLKKHRH